MDIKTLIEESHSLAVEKGWWDSPKREIPELLALIHSEVSEALEAYRIGEVDVMWYRGSGKPEGVVVELADTIIRIADLCGEFGLDLESALTEKMAYNRTRPYRHGDKRV